MLTIGLLHGMSSVATVDYYRRINERVNERLGGHERAELLLSSVNFGVIERYVRAQEWDEAGDYLASKARGLEVAGADFIVCGSNTMHRVAPAIEAAISVPFLHIADVVAKAAHQQGVRTLGLLGTLPVMEADFYRDRLAASGLSVLVPDQVDRHLVDQVIFDELTRYIFTDQSRAQYLRIMEDLAARGADAIILGCTEITQLVSPQDFPVLPLLDSTGLHVEAIVEISLASARSELQRS
ncbi:aspartate/glutamate racemase family protein [Nonomuraea zeae]|uniref:Aspartate/glutamate racemase family protein n=1 Tax=Nonomuraea zeae TaxID=1642303 RepID=A0A5S4GFY1_9ACTN|nr:aspartate/glutamate racemase family protein [Nonomuraea zeae]TMR31865.1 aspartate/glutamate racemase family protein [Nonomuraea zeae]